MVRTPPSKRLDRAELFSALGYAPHAGQQLVHRSKAPRRVLACGARWGKTTCAQYECVAAVLEPGPESLGWIVAPTYDHTARIFSGVAEVFGQRFEHRVIDLDLGAQRLAVVNFGGCKTQLRGRSADNPVSLLGEGLDFLVVDEAARLKESVWFEHLSQRLVDRHGWALLLSTPRGHNWFFRLFKRGQQGRDQAFESWSQPSWSNPHLDRNLIEAERERLPADAFREQYGAEFVGLDLSPCDRCQGPNPRAPGLVVLRPDECLARCIECGAPVDGRGQSLVVRLPDGRGFVDIITAQPRKSPPMPLPTLGGVVTADGARVERAGG